MTTWSRDLHVTCLVTWRSSFGPHARYTLLVVCVGMHENDDFSKKNWGKTTVTLIFFRPFYTKKLPMMGDFTWCRIFCYHIEIWHTLGSWVELVQLGTKQEKTTQMIRGVLSSSSLRQYTRIPHYRR